MSEPLPSRQASVELSVRQLEQALTLARRSHSGTATLEPTELNGLPWVAVSVLLTDMGDVPPLHTFYMDPRGVLRPAS